MPAPGGPGDLGGAGRGGYLGLGSNVGDRSQHLRAAIEMLGDHGIEVEAVSSIYETEPVGEVLDQPDFLNAAIRIRTELEPELLLDVCKAIEVEHGRMLAAGRHSPRTLEVESLDSFDRLVGAGAVAMHGWHAQSLDLRGRQDALIEAAVSA